MYNIGVDVMSGDHAHEELLKGCVDAVKNNHVIVSVVGEEKVLAAELKKYDYKKDRIEIIPSTEIITMTDPAAKAYKNKPDSSLVVGCRALADHRIDAFITPGNTGASLAAALFIVKRISGVKRPCISVSIPSEKGHTLLLDAGANVDCVPRYLKQFAVMGMSYVQKSRGVENPTIGVLNVGEEHHKGDELTQKSGKELEKMPINYVGYVEPADLYRHKADIVVCDGFVGNIALKTLESTAKYMLTLIKRGILKNWIYKAGAFLLKPVFKDLKKKLSSEENGAAPLLGIREPFYISHGSSTAAEIESAVRIALYNAEHSVNDTIAENIKKWG